MGGRRECVHAGVRGQARLGGYGVSDVQRIDFQYFREKEVAKILGISVRSVRKLIVTRIPISKNFDIYPADAIDRLLTRGILTFHPDYCPIPDVPRVGRGRGRVEAEPEILCSGPHPTSGVIYAMVDPLELARVRYVGQSVEPHARYKAHLHDASDAVGKWIADLRAGERYPSMRLLERGERDRLTERERYWIGHYRDRGMADLNRKLPDFKRERAWKFQMHPLPIVDEAEQEATA